MPAPTNPIHHADFTFQGCTLELRLNGFTVFEIGSEPSYNAAPPIQFFLIGEGNQLEAVVKPLEGADGALTTLLDAKVDGSVRAFAMGEEVGLGQGGTVLTTVSIPDTMYEAARRGELDLPVTLTASFDNTGPAFRARLVDAEPFDDREALLDYAIKLRDLFAAGDVDALVAENEPKAIDHAAAYYHDAPQEANLRDHLQNDILANSPDTDFERGDVEPVPHCDGRIWELQRDGGPELIETAPAGEGVFVIDIYVAPVDGTLKIVR